MPSCLDDLILPSTLPETNIDLDLNIMLTTVSPVHHHDLSSSSSYHSHSPSISSSSTISISRDIDFDIDMAFNGDEEASRRLMFPSSNQSYYNQPHTMPPQQMVYASQHTPLPNTQSWMSVPLFSQHQNAYNNGLPPNDIYPSFETNGFSSGGGITPATPQATEAPGSFFNALPSQPELLTPTFHRNGCSSHESNSTSIASSLSRSCSPSSIICTAPASYSTSTSSNHGKHLPPSPPPALSSQLQSQSSNSLHAYGILVPPNSPSAPQTWRCAYPNCSSRALFTRGCDLRKHFNRHTKHLFCRVKGCPQSGPRVLDDTNSGGSGIGGRLTGLGFSVAVGGFSSKKDRARHEAKHNPRILCSWVGEGGERCGRRFSRVDNMKDHVRRIHQKGQVESQSGERQETQGGKKSDGASVSPTLSAS
jgi:hypothetical protein